MLIGHLTPETTVLLQEAGLATLKVMSKPGRITLPGHVAQIVRNLSGQDASNLVGRIRMLSDGAEEVRHGSAGSICMCSRLSSSPGLALQVATMCLRLINSQLYAQSSLSPCSCHTQQGAVLGVAYSCSHLVAEHNSMA